MVHHQTCMKDLLYAGLCSGHWDESSDGRKGPSLPPHGVAFCWGEKTGAPKQIDRKRECQVLSMLKKIKGNERERKREGRRERKREWTGTRRSHQGSRERQTDR